VHAGNNWVTTYIFYLVSYFDSLKNNMNELERDPVTGGWRKSAILVCMIGMLAGLLFSRVLLSTASIVFVLLCFVHRGISQQLKVFFSSLFLCSMTLLFLVPFISGLWSEDLSRWSQILRIKLPLLLFPVCFAGIRNLKWKDWERIAVSFLILATGGVAWSLWQYLQNAKSVHADYLKAHTIETPLGNDHVRFSLLVAIAMLAAVFLLIKNGTRHKKTIGVLFLLIILFFVLYLHVLAVRTGLFCFYFGVFIYVSWLLRKRRPRPKYVLLLVLIILLPVLSYFILPTFRNRVRYLKYDLASVQKNIFVPGSNDGDRFFSLKAGGQLLAERPFNGVGFGDIKNETDKFYKANFPDAGMSDMILPSSEWIMYGDGAGWPGFILFSFSILTPFFVKEVRRNVFWLLLNLFMAFSYLFDIGLEVQYGVFIHAFVLLWWNSWLRLQR
jgi:hypothetical protein